MTELALTWPKCASIQNTLAYLRRTTTALFTIGTLQTMLESIRKQNRLHVVLNNPFHLKKPCNILNI